MSSLAPASPPAAAPASPAAPELAPFDGRPPSAARTRAAAMARFEGDAAFFERIVPLFRQAACDQSNALAIAAERLDAAAIEHWAHTLKGSLLTVGASVPAQRAERIESDARERRLDAMQARVRQLVAETAIVVEQLAAAPRG